MRMGEKKIMELDSGRIEDLLWGYEMSVNTREYGNIEVISIEDLMDDIIPGIIDMINEGIDNKIELI